MQRSKHDEEERLQRMTERERLYWARGIFPGGMDEVGRGPLAGPVTAACVVLPESPLIPYINDSKKLGEKRREALCEAILAHALCVGTASMDASVIDEINILQATRRAFAAAYAAMERPPSHVLVDALRELDIGAGQEAIVHGDALSYLIAAASIVAKVSRDRYMREMDALYPQYGFARNKGYGTKEHIEALRRYGPCPLHRRSFLKNIEGVAL